MNRAYHSLIATVALTLILTTSVVFAGAVKRGGDTSSGPPAPTATVTQSVTVTTGTVTNVAHWDGSFLNSANYTALSDTLPVDIFNQLITMVGANTQAGSQLQEIASNLQGLGALPCLDEFITANDGNASSTAFALAFGSGGCEPDRVDSLAAGGNAFYSGQENVVQAGLDTSTWFGYPSYTQDGSEYYSGAPGMTSLAQIEAATIGDRTVCETTDGPQAAGSYNIFTPVSAASTVTTKQGFGSFSFSSNTTSTGQNVVAETNVTVLSLTGSNAVSPIVLDVHGIGMLEASDGHWMPHSSQFYNPKTAKLFDFWANGYPMMMEWVGPHDGLLVEQKADGSIDGSCLFGIQGGWDSGYQKLSVRDLNKDGKLSGDELKGLSVWVDANENGTPDSGEVKTLAEMGITEINLRHRGLKSTFVMDGKSRTMWDWCPTAVTVKRMRLADVKAEVQ